MICPHCSHQTDDDGKFCRYCGEALAAPVTSTAEVLDEHNAEPSPVVSSEEIENPKKSYLARILFVIIIALSLNSVFQSYISKPSEEAKPAIVTPVASEYKTRMTDLQPFIRNLSIRNIKNELSRPETARIRHDWAAFSNDGPILTQRGTIAFIDSNDKEHKYNFEIIFVANEDHHYYCLSLKFDDTALYDDSSAIDNTGTIITRNTTFSGRGYGEPILDNLINPDNWAKNAADFNNMEDEITLVEFTALQLGMTYPEVCRIIGSSGTEISRAQVLDYENAVYIWEGIGEKDARATLSFTDGVLTAKLQTGLK